MKKIVIKLEKNTYDTFVKLCAMEKKNEANMLEMLMNSYSLLLKYTHLNNKEKP